MMFKRTMFKPGLLLLLAAGFCCSSALAQHGHDQGRGFGPGGHGGGPHGHVGGQPFHTHDGAFRGGHWEHGHIHGGGRVVWWWAPGPAWYYYPAPVYPYYAYPYSAPYDPAYAPAPPSSPFWYYCDAEGGYYPYVSQCPGGFRAIAPGDPNAPAPAPMPTPGMVP